MTTEEKAKAYDEALEKARIWKDKSGMPKDKQSILDDIFPELKESEDERIRKALIRFHKSTIDIDGIKGADVIAWLEKQGEQKSQRMISAEAKEALYDKPEWSEEDEEMLKLAIKSCEQCGNEYAYYWLKSLKDRVLPNQEWSEEDEKMIEAALQFAHEYGRHGLWCWLKSLRPQNKWKPSDEQIIALEYIINNVHNTSYSCKIAKELLEQLKKLK